MGLLLSYLDISQLMEYYQEDLAYIHDIGFSNYALQSVPDILKILRKIAHDNELIVELGCGSGLIAEKLVKAAYQVLGIDLSSEMINLAKNRVPNANFIVDSVYQVDIPSCAAVIAVGEVFNYTFDSSCSLERVFNRIYQALKIGGIFIFDLAEPSLLSSEIERKFLEGRDWYILIEKSSDFLKKQLTRRIITFRKIEDFYRKSEEVHVQNLYEPSEIVNFLQKIGFDVTTSRSYGSVELPDGRVVFFAKKD